MQYKLHFAFIIPHIFSKTLPGVLNYFCFTLKWELMLE